MRIEYRKRLLKAFPESLKNDVEVVLDILPFEIHEVKASDEIFALDNLIDTQTYTILVNHEILTIPYRIYIHEPIAVNEKKLTDTQKSILNCIYLRHHNGYIRHRRLKQLIGKHDIWIIPFTLQLLGEYVFEILQVLNFLITDANMDNYKKIKLDNPIYWKKTECRVVSYWHVYYRSKYPDFKNYLGKHIVDRINA